jgi:molecular chaperone HtpG
MQQGSIRVQTENIFPIIKQFLYSEQEIFVRELVSNAIDAINKLKTLSNTGEATGELGDLKVSVRTDAEAKTLTISDNGLGMTADEVDRYINQVAFSGAEEFVAKYKDKTEGNIIGHFGLGFYSAFMVSSKVEIFTKSYKDAPGVHWTCDGSPNYTIAEYNKDSRGTDIVLHLNNESEAYSDKDKITGILKKFGKFLPVPVWVEEEQINNTAPLWTRKPSELNNEDYVNFYKELYPFAEEPMFWIHLNVDMPFTLTGILYFPKVKNNFEVQKDKIQLYCNQVFVTDEVKEIVPEFLMLMHGVIDSPDIPLNVSRSYLQGDPNVKKITGHITSKVASKLEELFKKDRADYEKKWESLGLFVKYGMITEDKFLEKGNKFLLLQDIANSNYYTWEELKTKLETNQKDKDGKHAIIYTSDAVAQDAYIQAAQSRGYIVCKLDTIIDNGFVSNIEYKWENVKFVRVDSDIADNLVDKKEDNTSVLNDEQVTKLKELFGKPYDDMNLQVEVKGMSKDDAPIVASMPEFMRRMKDMAAAGGGMASFYGSMPTEIHLTLNGNHPAIEQVLKLDNEEEKTVKVNHLTDLALLSLGMLKGNKLTAFLNRSFGQLV